MDKSKTKFGSEDQQASLLEHLSAVLDDEAGSFEQRRVLDELKSNDDLSEQFSRYSLIGESMRSSKPVAIVGSDFLAGIHEEIDADSEYHNVALIEPKKQNSWLRPVGGFALAASVAAVAVIGVQNYQSPSSPDAMVASTQVNTAPSSNQSAPKEQLTQAEMKSAVVVSANELELVDTVASNQYRHANARTRSLLKRFVDKHIRHASTSSFVPSVRVIAYADFK